MEDYRLEQTGQEVQDILNGAAMQTDLTAETERAEGAEGTLQRNIDAEELARQNADGTLQGNIDAEETRAKAAEKQNADDIDAIEEKIPSGASSSNKLATQEYVDDSVATATATFRGTFNLVSDLHLTLSATEGQIATALAGAILTSDNNDYCFVQIPTSTETPTEIARIDRYKFNGTAWSFEYSLNNSGFTAAQWAAINSGITSGLVAKLGDLPTASALATALAGKQDTLTFDNAPTENSQNPVKSGGVYTAVHNEAETRSGADAALQAAIEGILALIPSAATALNQLADKAFVNSSIATDSATFRGTYNLVSDLSLAVDATHAQIAEALLTAISTADNNDYAFVQIPTSADTPTEIRVTERYKFNGTAWAYEYDLNNSGFTAAQWAAINSGITLALVTKLGALPTASELTQALNGKQNTLTFDSVPVSGSQNPVYSGGLYTLFAAIDAKMPSAASASNKLVDENRLAAYVATIIGAIDASYNVTSTDGHVSVNITQADGAITSLQVLTSDIASASALTTLTGRVSTNEQDIADLQELYQALSQTDVEPMTAADWATLSADTSNLQERVIYRVAGTTSYTDYMWNGTSIVAMATYNNAIDNVPTKDSNNLVKSGGVVSYIEDRETEILLSDMEDLTPLNSDWFATNLNSSVSYYDSTNSQIGMPFYPLQPKYIKWYPTVDLTGSFRFLIVTIPQAIRSTKFSSGFWVKNDFNANKEFRMWVTSTVEGNTLTFSRKDTFYEGFSQTKNGLELVVDKIYNNWAHFNIKIDGTVDSTRESFYIGSTIFLASDRMEISIPIFVQSDIAWYINYNNASRNKNIDDSHIKENMTWSSQKINAMLGQSQLSGKKVNWIGDSIFYGGGNDGNNGWIGRIKDTYGVVFESLARNGALIIDPENPQNYSISLKCTDFVETNPDFVIFDGGTNDGFNPTISPLGTFDHNRYDAPNDKTTSFSSAFEYTIYHMITAYPNAKIGYIIPYKQISYNGNIDVYDITGTAYFNRAIEICKKWGVPYLDLREKSDLCYQIPALQSKFSDFVHINGDGYDYSYNIVAEWLKTL